LVHSFPNKFNYSLFRQGGKSLHDFATNLFGKLCSRFRQSRPSFVEGITKNILFFFLDTYTDPHQTVAESPFCIALCVVFVCYWASLAQWLLSFTVS